MNKASHVYVIIPGKIRPTPSRKEVSAAQILLKYFHTNIEFIPRNNLKTPDLLINQTEWELKSPTGDGKRNLQHTISRAIKQSRYIIIDVRNSRTPMPKIRSYLQHEVMKNKQIKRLILIDKQNNVFEFFKR